MKKLLLAGISFAALVAGPALAADLGRPVYRPVLAPVAVYNWTGFYVGGNVGYVASRNSMSTVATPTPDVVFGIPPGVTEGLAALATGPLPSGNTNGFIGGGQIGYNWQFGNYVAGVETDIQGLSQSNNGGTITLTQVVVGRPVTSTRTASETTRYLGTARGRLGFLVGPAFLVYGTGGLAYGDTNASYTLTQTGTNGFVGLGSGGLSGTRAGWTAGVGAEWRFVQNWSAKLEYLHYDLGSPSFSNVGSGNFLTLVPYQTGVTSTQFRGDIVRVGLNYKLGYAAAPALIAGSATAADLGRPVYSRPVVAAPVYNWTGLYVGGNAGYGWGRIDTVYTSPGIPFGFLAVDQIASSANGSPGLRPTGFVGGGQIGYNWQVAPSWIVGGEADFNAFALKDTFNANLATPIAGPQITHTNVESNWLFTFRGRAGYAFDRWLVYGTGGLAVANVNFEQSNAYPAFPLSSSDNFSASTTRTGWTAGAGVEYIFVHNWSLKAEYLYVDLGSISGTSSTTGYANVAALVTHTHQTDDFRANIVRVGLNYKFGYAVAPAVYK